MLALGLEPFCDCNPGFKFRLCLGVLTLLMSRCRATWAAICASRSCALFKNGSASAALPWSPDRTAVCCAGRSAPSQCKMVTGPGFSSPNQPDQERTTAYRDSSGPNSRSDAHCATIVGDWEEPSGESQFRSVGLLCRRSLCCRNARVHSGNPEGKIARNSLHGILLCRYGSIEATHPAPTLASSTY